MNVLTQESDVQARMSAINGGSYKVTYDLYKKYGEMRLLDTPICGALSGALPMPACSYRSNKTRKAIKSAASIQEAA